MLRLFFKIFLLIMAMVLVGKWTVDYFISKYVISDRQRVVPGLVEVHLGSLRVISSELLDAREEKRERRWRIMKDESRYPLELRPLSELSESQQQTLKKPDGFIYKNRNEIVDYLGVAYDDKSYVRLGPISDQTSKLIEDELSGWMRLLATKIQRNPDPEKIIRDFNRKSKVTARLQSPDAIPNEVHQQLRGGRENVFYSSANDFFIAKLIPDRDDVLIVGPLPKVKDLAGSITSKSMLVWMLIFGSFLGWMIYKLSGKFKRVELAAKRISEGQFDARVDVSNAGEARELARVFNVMASKTEALIRSKRELLQVISHELRTPLSRLRFASELLKTPGNEQSNSSRMRILERSIDELESLVQEIIDFVVHEDVKPKQHCQWLSIEDELRDIIEPLKIEYPHLIFEHQFASDQQRTRVYADQTAFHRVIGNLTSNAVRYAKSKLLLQVYTCKASSIDGNYDHSNQEYVCIEVQDDGPGIPKDKRDDAISPFVRLDDSASSFNQTQSTQHTESQIPEQQIKLSQSRARRIPSGLGLGLSIVDQILKQHGGSLTIDTSSLGGCSIRTQWPLPMDAATNQVLNAEAQLI